MKDVFIADAHLVNPEDENYRRLLQFLERLEGRTRRLFLLGDIFEFWMGYRHVVFTPYVSMLEALRRLRSSGTEIVYVEGNHDFHLGPFFERELDCRVLPDGGSVDLGGTRAYITHGDLINSGDWSYRMLRKLLRSRVLQGVQKIVPPDQAWRIARWGSRQSDKRHGPKKDFTLPEQMLVDYARQRFAEGNQAVITGHFHAPLHKKIDDGTLISLGDWIEDFCYAVWEDGTFTLNTFNPAED